MADFRAVTIASAEHAAALPKGTIAWPAHGPMHATLLVNYGDEWNTPDGATWRTHEEMTGWTALVPKEVPDG